MLTPDLEEVISLLKSYLGKRPRRGPFPLESAFTWSTLLSSQRKSDLRGNMLEIGVEFGTSAFLMLETLRSDEKACFIDLVATEEWRQGITGPYRDTSNVQFIEGNSLHMAAANLPANCRWIHIDGGHLYEHVSHDLALTAESLSADGVMVLDDFFEIRWPDVTVAILDFLRRDSRLVPFMLVNRKLYCTRNREYALGYQGMFSEFLQRNNEQIGHSRWWTDVQVIEQGVLVAKLDFSQQLQALERDKEG